MKHDYEIFKDMLLTCIIEYTKRNIKRMQEIADMDEFTCAEREALTKVLAHTKELTATMPQDYEIIVMYARYNALSADVILDLIGYSNVGGK